MSIILDVVTDVEEERDEEYRPIAGEDFPRGVTGIDADARHFDGRNGTGDPEFLIDLETGSMERLPDVRVYFYLIWWMGMPRGPARRHARDQDEEDLWVKWGREYLRHEMSEGRGYFLAPRPWQQHNVEGSEWETIPYGPVVKDLVNNVTPRLDGDSDWTTSPKPGLTVAHGMLVKTNVRAPLFPLDCVVARPGSTGWDFLIWDTYGDYHPAVALRIPDVTRACHTRSMRLIEPVEDEDYTTLAWQRYQWDGRRWNRPVFENSVFQGPAIPRP